MGLCLTERPVSRPCICAGQRVAAADRKSPSASLPQSQARTPGQALADLARRNAPTGDVFTAEAVIPGCLAGRCHTRPTCSYSWDAATFPAPPRHGPQRMDQRVHRQRRHAQQFSASTHAQGTPGTGAATARCSAPVQDRAVRRQWEGDLITGETARARSSPSPSLSRFCVLITLPIGRAADKVAMATGPRRGP